MSGQVASGYNYLVEERQGELVDLLRLDPAWQAEYGHLTLNSNFLLSNDYDELFLILKEMNSTIIQERRTVTSWLPDAW